MAFPQTPLPIKGELLIDGTWINVTSYLRKDADVRINRGRGNEQGRIGPTRCDFTLNNRDGRFSNRNPMSPYYGLLPLNTQFRVSVTEETPFMDLRQSTETYYVSGVPRAYTSDKAALDITGDIDVRIDLAPDYWPRNATYGMTLCGKYRVSTSSRSWLLILTTNSNVRFYWSTDGTTGTRTSITSTEPIDTSAQRLAIRVVLDVDNGSGGHTATFYTAPTISGSWTQLGDTVTVSGTTSIFAGTSDVEVGASNNGLQEAGDSDEVGGGNTFFDTPPVVGRVYGFELRNGSGTLVADFDPTGRTPGDTSWSDGLGNTWNLHSPAEVTADDRRFTGEVSQFPQVWDSTGTDIYVPTQASGLIRRLTQGAKSLKSPIYRFLSRLDNVGYWPMEDGGLTENPSNATPGAPPSVATDVSFGFEDTLPQSQGVMRISSTASRVSARGRSTTLTDQWTFLWYFKMSSLPAAETDLINIWAATVGTTEEAARFRITVSNTNYKIYRYNINGGLEASQATTFGSGAEPTDWIAMRLQVVDTDGAGSIEADLGWYPLGDNTIFYGMSTMSWSGGGAGRPSGWSITGSTGLTDTMFAHIFQTQEEFVFNTYAFLNAANGYTGEYAGYRFRRICEEEGIPYVILGDYTMTELMGIQPTDTLMNILYDCVDTDDGHLSESRHTPALQFRTRYHLMNQAPVTLDYAQNHLSGELLPTEDDQSVRNEVTASRPRGGFYTHTVTEGPNSVQEPPDGVGRYESTVTPNVSVDSRLKRQAEWHAFIGTWDELRYPNVQVDLERQPFTDDPDLLNSLKALDQGDRLDITELPSWLPPGDARLMVQGYQETLKNKGWAFKWNTTPYGPYLPNDLNDDAQSPNRLAATNSVLDAGITSSATSFDVETATGRPWANSTDKPNLFPIDIVIGGEVMTVGAISAATAGMQTFSSVTRSVNGIVKAHSAGASVDVADPFYVVL